MLCKRTSSDLRDGRHRLSHKLVAAGRRGSAFPHLIQRRAPFLGQRPILPCVHARLYQCAVHFLHSLDGYACAGRQTGQLRVGDGGPVATEPKVRFSKAGSSIRARCAPFSSPNHRCSCCHRSIIDAYEAHHTPAGISVGKRWGCGLLEARP